MAFGQRGTFLRRALRNNNRHVAGKRNNGSSIHQRAEKSTNQQGTKKIPKGHIESPIKWQKGTQNLSGDRDPPFEDVQKVTDQIRRRTEALGSCTHRVGNRAELADARGARSSAKKVRDEDRRFHFKSEQASA